MVAGPVGNINLTQITCEFDGGSGS
jgi:hypothetical protein